MSIAMPSCVYWEELKALLRDKFNSIDNDIIYFNQSNEQVARWAQERLKQKYPDCEFECIYDDDIEEWTVEVWVP